MHDKYKQEGTTYQAIVRQPSPEKEQDIFFFYLSLDWRHKNKGKKLH